MKINLKNINYYFLNCDKGKRMEHMFNEFKDYNLIPVHPVMGIHKWKSGATGMMRIIDLAAQHQPIDQPFKPYMIFEDDLKKYRTFPEEIEIPDDCDLFYPSLCRLGLYVKNNKKNGNALVLKNVSDSIIKIFNMLNNTAIIVCSVRGALCLQKCLMEDYFIKRPYDLSLAQIQSFINVYAFKKPLVYQDGIIGGTMITENNTKFELKDPIDKELTGDIFDINNVSIITNYS